MANILPWLLVFRADIIPWTMSKSVEKEVVGKCVIFQHPCSDLHFPGAWGNTKNPYPLRNRIFPNLATAGNPGMTRPAASRFQGHDSCLGGNYVISQWVWVLAMISSSWYGTFSYTGLTFSCLFHILHGGSDVVMWYEWGDAHALQFEEARYGCYESFYQLTF